MTAHNLYLLRSWRIEPVSYWNYYLRWPLLLSSLVPSCSGSRKGRGGGGGGGGRAKGLLLCSTDEDRHAEPCQVHLRLREGWSVLFVSLSPLSSVSQNETTGLADTARIVAIVLRIFQDSFVLRPIKSSPPFVAPKIKVCSPYRLFSFEVPPYVLS